MATVIIKVLPHLFIGTAAAAAQRYLLEQKGISRLISCDNRVYSYPNIKTRRTCLTVVQQIEDGTSHSTFNNNSARGIPVSTTASNLFDVLPPCFDFIDAANDSTCGQDETVPKTMIYSEALVKKFNPETDSSLVALNKALLSLLPTWLWVKAGLFLLLLLGCGKSFPL